MTVKLPKMTRSEIDELLQNQILCRIAFKGEEHPYIAPFQYTTIKGSLYFHFTDYGKKMKMLQADKRVCVEIESYSPNLAEYKFVSLRGQLELVKDPKERAEAITKLMEEGKQRLSKNFLAAHGFNTSDDWSSLSPEKPLVIVKLGKVRDVVALRSPQ